MIAKIKTSSPLMCNCVSHKELETVETTLRESLKYLIRAPHQLDAVTGNEYTMGLLNYLFHLMDMENFKPSQTGRIREVSYTY